MDFDITILGAGPYGLAAAAFLRRIPGFSLSIFGEPMYFWRKSMPRGMFLRSSWSASHIADPDASLTLDAYKTANGNHLSTPILLQRFVDYGMWYQASAVPNLDRRQVLSVDPYQAGFRLRLDDATTCTARRVIVAAGLTPFATLPPEFQAVPPSLASHGSQHHDFAKFAGKHVAVVGAGQSALECAALLHEAGASVEIIVRRSGVHWLGWKDRLRRLHPVSSLLLSPADVGPPGFSRLIEKPRLFRRLPRYFQDDVSALALRPAGARWLMGRLRDVPITTRTSVTRAVPFGDRLRLALSDATTRLVDHVILGTGYRVNVARYPFFGPEILKVLHVRGGFPRLTSEFESSVPGLYFLGASSAWSFGPLMYFVSGTKFAAHTLTRHFSRLAGVRA